MPNTPSRWPPAGVILLCLLYVVVASMLLLTLIPEPSVAVPDPVPENYFCFDCGGYDPWAFPSAPYLLGLGC